MYRKYTDKCTVPYNIIFSSYIEFNPLYFLINPISWVIEDRLSLALLKSMLR